MKPSTSSLPLSAPREGALSRDRAAFIGLILLLGMVGAAGLAGAVGGRVSKAEGRAYQADHSAGAVPASAPSPAVERLGMFSGAGQPMSGAAKSLATGPASPSVGTGQPDRIEETGGITMVVPGAQIQPDISRVMALAVASGGFVASTQTQSASPGNPAQGTVTLQVPEASFGAVLAQVRGLGRVASLTTSANDVTGQYVDLQARISALQDSRQQYLTIMSKATTIGGILAVQAQLDNLQSQLEQLQGQLQVLNNETTYATLAVTLTQKAVTPPPPRPTSGLSKAWDAAVGGFVAGFEGLVRVTGPLFFALLLLAAVVLLGRWAWGLRPRRSD